jgi:uncharacterized membrane protein
MPMKLRLERPRLRFRLVLAALVSIGILHIVSILIAPGLAVAPAFVRLEPLLPLNKMVVLPAIAPGTQPLPFLSPSARYAMCRFATDKGAIEVQAKLPSAGWTLSVHLVGGENVYTATAEPGRLGEVRILLTPVDDRFLGLTPEARGIAREGPGLLEVPARSGIAVVRAPDAGVAFLRQVEADLARARCAPQ